MKLFFLSLLLCLSAAAQDFDDIRLDRVAAGLTFADGPAWSPMGFLIFSDVPENKLLQFKAGEPASTFRENSNGANGNRFDAQGRLYTCESHSRRVTRPTARRSSQRKRNIDTRPRREIPVPLS